MAKKKKTGSGVGFNPEARSPKKSTGYETIFEKIVKKADGEKKSLMWYMSTLNTLTNELKIIPDEVKDNSGKEDERDENVLRLFPLQGHLYFFEYEAKMKYLPYYDKFPLVYVLSQSKTEFYGANLHYINPKKRPYIITDLKKGKINIPKNIIHKYLRTQVKSFFLDLAEEEWETSILLPVENFVKTSKSGKIPYERTDVWDDIDKGFNNKLKGERITKEYGLNK